MLSRQKALLSIFNWILTLIGFVWVPQSFVLAQSPGTLEYDTTDTRLESYNGFSWISTDVSTTATGCTKEGSFHYNSSNHTMEFCDGSLWHAMNGADTTDACLSPGSLNYNSIRAMFEFCSGSTNTWWIAADLSYINITVNDVTVVEGNNVVFTITASASVPADLNIVYSTNDNTALAGTHYTTNSGTATISEGATTTTVTVSTVDLATVCQNDVDFTIDLSSSSYGTITDSQGVGTIQDDDFPEITIANTSELEGVTHNLSATLNFACPSDVMSVNYFTSDLTTDFNSDYTPTSGTLTFPAGTTGPQNFSVLTSADTDPEADERLTIGLNNFVFTKLSSSGFPILTILDDDAVGEVTVKVAAGSEKSCALSSNGRVKCWGREGRVGVESNFIGDEPHEVWANLPFIDMGTHDQLGVTPHTIKSAMVTGENNGCAILDDDRMKCWGFRTGYGGAYGNDGATHGFEPNTMGDNLGYVDLGTHDALGITPHTAVKVEGQGYAEAFCVILDDGRLKCFGGSDSGHCAMIGLESTSCYLGDNPNEMGDNLPYVNLGTHDALGVTPHTVTDIAIGNANTCAVLDDGRVKCWGSVSGYGYGDSATRGNNAGQMGDNLGYVDLGTHDMLGVTPHTAKSIHGNGWGGTSFCVILDDDRIKCWGQNGSGRLGLGDTATRGDNPNELGDNLPYVDLGTHGGLGLTPHTVKDINGDNSRGFCAILDTDQAKCWGSQWASGSFAYGTGQDEYGSSGGQMGDNLPYMQLGTGRTAKKIKFGGYVTTESLVLRDDDTIVAYGNNDNGALGLGITTEHIGNSAAEVGDNSYVLNLGGATPVNFAGGGPFDTYCIIFSNGKMKCAGGFVGSNATIGEWAHLGHKAGQMGFGIPDVNLPAGRTAIDIFAAWDDICITLDNFEHFCFGDEYRWSPQSVGDRTAQLQLLSGANQIKYRHAEQDACVLDEFFDLYCFDMSSGNLSATSPLDFGSGLKVLDFDLGGTHDEHYCAILNDNQMRCWGEANNGQIGSGDNTDVPAPYPGMPVVDLGTTSYPVQVNVTAKNTCVLFANNQIKCFGDYSQPNYNGIGGIGNDPSEMGDNLPFINFGAGRTVAKMFTSKLHDVCVRLDNNDVTCWGENGIEWWNAYTFSGFLGFGNTSSVPGPSGSYTALDLNGDFIEQLDIGHDHICALTGTQDIKCWGDNNFGQLGQEDTQGRGDQAGEMGANLDIISLTWGDDQSTKRIFVSSATYDGNLGGLSGADTACQGLADAQTLGGTWKALLSDSSTDAAARINKPVNNIELIDSTVVAVGWLDLIDGGLANSVTMDETGATVTGATVATGSSSSFTKASTNAIDHCSDWISNSVGGGRSGTYGVNNSQLDTWINNGTGLCNATLRLYCLEQ